jgi:uncharacterized membrane protein
MEKEKKYLKALDCLIVSLHVIIGVVSLFESKILSMYDEISGTFEKILYFGSVVLSVCIIIVALIIVNSLINKLMKNRKKILESKLVRWTYLILLVLLVFYIVISFIFLVKTSIHKKDNLQKEIKIYKK